MFFSKIELRRDAPDSRSFWSRLASGYDIHQELWKLFGDHPDRARDFIYRREGQGLRTSYYAVSHRPPEEDGMLWSVMTRAYAPRLVAGNRLSFVLRCNPVRTLRNEAGRQKRHDVVMHAKTLLKSGDLSEARRQLSPESRKNSENPLDPESHLMSEGQPVPGVGQKAGILAHGQLEELIQEVSLAWLEERAGKHGFEIAPGAVRAEGYRQHKLFKRKGRTPIQLSTVDFCGILTVTEPEAFVSMLFDGLGPAKAFGCGLMLIRRI